MAGVGCWTSHSQGATRFGGWNADGVKRFNQLCALIVTDHKNNGAFNIDYLTTMTTQLHRQITVQKQLMQLWHMMSLIVKSFKYRE